MVPGWARNKRKRSIEGIFDDRPFILFFLRFYRNPEGYKIQKDEEENKTAAQAAQISQRLTSDKTDSILAQLRPAKIYPDTSVKSAPPQNTVSKPAVRKPPVQTVPKSRKAARSDLADHPEQENQLVAEEFSELNRSLNQSEKEWIGDRLLRLVKAFYDGNLSTPISILPDPIAYASAKELKVFLKSQGFEKVDIEDLGSYEFTNGKKILKSR